MSGVGSIQYTLKLSKLYSMLEDTRFGRKIKDKEEHGKRGQECLGWGVGWAILNSLIEKVLGQDTIQFISRNIFGTTREPEAECEEMGAERVVRRPLQ